MSESFRLYDPVADVIATVSSEVGFSGGTLIDDLTMQSPAKIIQCQAPTNSCDLTNKAYVDSTIASAINILGTGPFLPLAGGTMTGAITQAVPPTTNLHLTNKGYVDAQLATIGTGPFLPLAGGTMTGTLVQPLAPSNANDVVNKNYVDNSVSALGTGPFLPLAGGTMTGALVQPLAPSNANDVVNKTYVDNSVSALGTGPFLPLAGGTMTGALVQPLAPSNANDVVNKTYVDNSVSAITVDDATTSVKGIVQLAGDLGGAGTTAAAPIISNLAITNAKMADMSGTSQLKGSSSSTANVADISLGPGLTMTGTSLDINPGSIPSIPVPVSQGGTGATALTGYLIGNGTSAVTTSATIPTTDLSGQFVGSVNGIAPTPTSGGNVAILPQNVTTGVLSALPAAGNNGYIYVVSGDPTPSNNGRTYIDDGTTWNEVTANLAATDARYTLKAGDTMTGDLIMSGGTKITLPDAPVGSTDAANKAYVDAQIISGSIPDATTLIKGKVQLAGDLGGAGTTADAPVISNLAITNAKLANMSGTSQLKGSSNASNTATDITLGSGLTMTGTTLNIDSSVLQKAGNTQFGTVEFDSTGDLTETAPNSGIALVKNGAITPSKIASLSGTSKLLGSSSTGTTVSEITIGSGLTMTGTTLTGNASGLGKLVRTVLQAVAAKPLTFILSDPNLFVEYNGIRFASSDGGSLYVQWPLAKVFVQVNYNRNATGDSTYGGGGILDFTTVPSFNDEFRRLTNTPGDVPPINGGTADVMMFDTVSMRQINAFVLRPPGTDDFTWIIWEI